MFTANNQSKSLTLRAESTRYGSYTCSLPHELDFALIWLLSWVINNGSCQRGVFTKSLKAREERVSLIINRMQRPSGGALIFSVVGGKKHLMVGACLGNAVFPWNSKSSADGRKMPPKSAARALAKGKFTVCSFVIEMRPRLLLEALQLRCSTQDDSMHKPTTAHISRSPICTRGVIIGRGRRRPICCGHFTYSAVSSTISGTLAKGAIDDDGRV